MPPREWLFRARDILEAIERIRRYVSGCDAASFFANQLLIDAVLRNLGVIGEAARHFPAGIEERYPQIPWREMRDMRNLLVHEYFGISLDVVWEAVQRDLAPLASAVQMLIEREQGM